MTMKRYIWLLICFGTVVVSACGSEADNQGEDYGDLNTTGGVILTEARHANGWAQPDCLDCHNLENTHIGSGISQDTVRVLWDEYGYEGCASCHGDNGIQ